MSFQGSEAFGVCRAGGSCCPCPSTPGSGLSLRLSVSPDLWNDWRWQFENRLRGEGGLARIFGPGGIDACRRVLGPYPFAATPYYLSLADWSNPQDPILAQCLPDPREVCFHLPGSGKDPLAEEVHSPVPGLIHRYPDRALLVTTSLCAVLCRHCNRKRNWRRPWALSRDGFKAAVDYIRKTPSIREVIFSGGDALLVNPAVLDAWMGEIRRIPHVEVLRIGTRVPVVMPMRVTDDLVRILERHRPLWVNTQFNHPREVTPEAATACERILRAGIPVSNQTVLLKGVNDSPETIQALCHALQRISVRPYYLFQCDTVEGTDHFRTPISTGISIIESLWGRTGGLAIPNYVVDLPEGGGKARAVPSHLVSMDGDAAVFRTSEGRTVRYPLPPVPD
ncbi:MAG: KamA family radical SAM protein [Deltaproteobacteria bacterium]